MIIDKYSKIVLTVIAVNLTILTLSNLDIIPKAYANEPKNLDLNTNNSYGLIPINDDGSINVKLNPSQVLDVNIAKINGYSDTFYNDHDGVGGVIPVNVRN